MRPTQRKQAGKQQQLIASFFAAAPARKPLTTPERVVERRTNSRLSSITTSKGAFDEFGSSDTSFGLPEVNNFSNPVLSKLSRSASTTGLPERGKSALPTKGLFVVPDSDDEKENNVPGVSQKAALKRSASEMLGMLNGTKRLTKKPPPTQYTPPPPSLAEGKMIRLSDEQRAIVNYVVHKEQNVFFTGSAGTGKSVVLRHLVQELYRKHGQVNVGVTASTGLAACNINGQTVHKYLSIGLGTGSPQDLANRIKKQGAAKRKWRSIKVLIVDEISMIDGNLFTKIDQVAQILRNSQQPFGGIQVVCTGDFFQLPPVSRDGLSQYCFQSPSWARAMTHTITLTQVFRQKGDTELIDMLNALRKGELEGNMVMKFHLLLRKVHYDDGIEPTELFPTRQEVKRANETRLHQLPGELHRYVAKDNELDPQLKRLYENLMCDEVLDLKVGAQVMYLKNHPDDVVVNGSIGTVLGFMSEKLYEIVCLAFGVREFLDASPEFVLLVRLVCGLVGKSEYSNEQRAMFASLPVDWKSKMAKLAVEAFKSSKSDTLLPVVNFRGSSGFALIMVRRQEFTVDPGKAINFLGKKEGIVREQLPLLLAWAMSIHKAQGQSIDRLRVDLRRIFEKGQVYVALSRATCKEHLEILNFDHRRITVSKEVRDFYDSLEVHKG